MRIANTFSLNWKVLHSRGTAGVLWHGIQRWLHKKKQAPYYILEKKRQQEVTLWLCLFNLLISSSQVLQMMMIMTKAVLLAKIVLGITHYASWNITSYFLHFQDTVKEGNGTLHKQLVSHFNTLPGFNNYAIEMLISVVQNSGFLSDAEAPQCIWASTINWRGDARNKIEIDLLQENRNKSLKKSSRQQLVQ